MFTSKAHDHIVLFNQETDLSPKSIFHATSLFHPNLGLEQQTTIVLGSIKRFRVGFRSQLLHPIQLGTLKSFIRRFKRVRVVEIVKGEKDKNRSTYSTEGLSSNWILM